MSDGQESILTRAWGDSIKIDGTPEEIAELRRKIKEWNDYWNGLIERDCAESLADWKTMIGAKRKEIEEE